MRHRSLSGPALGWPCSPLPAGPVGTKALNGWERSSGQKGEGPVGNLTAANSIHNSGHMNVAPWRLSVLGRQRRVTTAAYLVGCREDQGEPVGAAGTGAGRQQRSLRLLPLPLHGDESRSQPPARGDNGAPATRHDHGPRGRFLELPTLLSCKCRQQT